MKLTSERCSGIKSGYWSKAKKDQLVQRLGAIEHKGAPLIQIACNKKCCGNQRLRMSGAMCDNCEIYKLALLIGGIVE